MPMNGGGVNHPGEVDWLRPALGRPSWLIAGGPKPRQGWFTPPTFLLPFLLTSLLMVKEVHYIYYRSAKPG